MAQTELATVARTGVLQLSVVTPTGAAVTTEADQVEAPSVAGEFGVLPGHRPLLAALRAGIVRYRSAGKTFVVAVDQGFAEVSHEAMTVLTDRCVASGDVDAASARASLDAATKRMASAEPGADFDAAAREAEWCTALLDAAREGGRA